MLPRESPQQQTEGGLLSLVDELLLSIIDQIDSRESLRNLAATCARLRSLTEPYIWRSLLVRKGDHAIDIVKALDSREARASYIHELSIRYQHGSGKGIDQLNHHIGLMDKLRHLTIESPCPNNTEWVRSDHFDDWTKINYTSLLEAAVYPPPGLPPVLPMLQSLALHGHGRDERKFVLGRTAVVFFHPTLRHLTLSCTNFDADITHADISPEKRKSTPLQSLTLIECNVNVQFLDVVLDLPKALKELYIGERLYVFKEHPSRDPKKRTSHPLFLTALARQADSLEKLTHVAGTFTHLLPTQIDDQASRSKLRSLKNLTFLEIGLESSLYSYLEQNDYPDSLKTLRINDAAVFQTLTDQTLVHHPGDVLKRCTDLVTRRTSHPFDLEVCFNDSAVEDQILSTIPHGRYAAILAALLGGSIRSPVYKLASALEARGGAHLRLFSQRFHSGKSYIPPYMYGEEVPSEVQFYDSDDFWRFSGRNFRAVDDDALKEELRGAGKEGFVCFACARRQRTCYNLGDGSACVVCESEGKECCYEGMAG